MECRISDEIEDRRLQLTIDLGVGEKVETCCEQGRLPIKLEQVLWTILSSTVENQRTTSYRASRQVAHGWFVLTR